MPDDLLTRIDRCLESARLGGALQPIRTESTHLYDDGCDFTVRWVSSLARKDSERVDAATRRTPGFNPFLPPDPALTVGPIGERHLGVLNKFPVIARHLLIVTTGFEEQTAPLSTSDFGALSAVLRELGGLGFYNGGPDAGASQRHKHLQWIPAHDDMPEAQWLLAGLPPAPPGQPTEHPALPWRQRVVRLPECTECALAQAFNTACRDLDLDPSSDPMPPYNLLVTRDWLMLVPRTQEHHAGISVNALGFAGSLFVRHPEQIELIRQLTPLRLLAAVAQAR